MNKLRSSSVVRPDPREDGFVKTSNVTKFLAACASYGLSNEDLFQRDDLVEATSESLARVAKTVITLFKFVDSPPPSRFIAGQALPIPFSPPPYGQATNSRGSSSAPNLISKSSSSVSRSPTRKRWSPSSDLPTLRSHSPDDHNNSVRVDPKLNSVDIYQDAEFKSILVPRLKPPPRSPLRRPSTKQHEDTWSRNISSSSIQDQNQRCSAAESTRASIGDGSIRDSVNDELQRDVRQSLSSSMLSESTAITTSSSMFGGRNNSNPFGTIRTMTTDLTSEAPSLSRAEGNLIAEDLDRSRSIELASGKCGKERKLSEPATPDLSRVAEETDESVSSKGHATTASAITDNGNKAKARSNEPALYLRKGKWPEDFMDALQAHAQSQPISTRDLFPDQDHSPPQSPIPNSPRKLAIVGAAAVRAGSPQESSPSLPRRPTHRPRHSVDVPTIIMPKDAVLRRGSPDSGRLIPRRHSTKPAGSSRSAGILIPRSSNKNKNNTDENFDNDLSFVPFPRTTSAASSSPGAGETVLQNERSRILRGRFQSEIDGASSSKKRGRPNSYELGAKSPRSRIESMIDLGVGSGRATASDLMSRDPLDDSAIRMRLVVKEDGKPPTHFVSFFFLFLNLGQH